MDGPWTQYATPPAAPPQAAPAGPWAQYARQPQAAEPTTNAEGTPINTPTWGTDWLPSRQSLGLGARDTSDLPASAPGAEDPMTTTTNIGPTLGKIVGAAGDIAKAGAKGAAEGFGTEPLGLSPQSEDGLVKAGIYNAPDEYNPLKGLNKAVIGGASAAADLALRAGNAAFRGGQAAVAQTGAELGAPQLGRDIAAFPEAFMGSPHPLGLPERIATPGEIARDVVAAPTIEAAIDAATRAASGATAESPQFRLLRQTEGAILRRVDGDESRLTPAESARVADLRAKMAQPMQIEQLNWGDATDGDPRSGANDVYPNPLARTQTSIQTPAFMPPGSQIPTEVIQATRPEFIPPAPSDSPVAADAGGPLTQVMRRGTTTSGVDALNSNRVQSPTRAANDVNPMLQPPANDAEAYPAWNASRAQQPTEGPAPPSGPATRYDPIETPNQTVPGFRSAGAAASREMTNPAAADISMADMKANRRRAEMDEILTPPQANDTMIYVNGSFPTLAERSGDPLVSQYENLLRQRNPGEFVGEGKILTENNKARVSQYDDNTIPDTTLNTMRKDRNARWMAASDDILPNARPANLTPALDWVQSELSNPRIQENDAVRSVLEDFRDRIVNDGGDLKSDPSAVWGIHDNLQNQLAKAKDPLNMTGAEKFAEAQILTAKGLIDKALNVATDNRFQSALDRYAEDSKAINAGMLFNEFRPKLTNMSGDLQAQRFHQFVVGLAKERGNPGIDPSMDISDRGMRSMINIDNDLKRAGLIKLGSAAGSPTNLLGALAESAGLDAAHSALSKVPAIGPLLSVGQKYLAQKKLNHDTARHISPPEGGYTYPTPE